MWYHHIIVTMVIMIILITITVIKMRFQLAGSGWARYAQGVSAVDVHYVCATCALHVRYMCITRALYVRRMCISRQARQPSEIRLRGV